MICSVEGYLWFPMPHNAWESTESGGTIHLEINFLSKVYSKRLLNRLYDTTCDPL